MGDYEVGDYVVYRRRSEAEEVVEITEILKDHPSTYLSRYNVREADGRERPMGGMYIARRHRAPLLGECDTHSLGPVGNGCYCEECGGPSKRVLVSEFSQQRELLSTPELQGSAGVCLALALFWCKHRRIDASAGDWQTFRSPLGETGLRTDLKRWMDTIQFEVQAGLEGRAPPPTPKSPAAQKKAQFYKDKIGGFYRRHGISPVGTVFEELMARNPAHYAFWEGGSPVGELVAPSSGTEGATTRAQLNYYRAYAFKLEKIGQWAKEHGLIVVDQKIQFNFAAGKAPDPMAGWSVEAAEFAASHGGRSGLISVTGEDGGHTLGFVIQEDVGVTYYRLFDPDNAEWVCSSREDFKDLVKHCIYYNWSRKNRTWWVLRFA